MIREMPWGQLVVGAQVEMPSGAIAVVESLNANEPGLVRLRCGDEITTVKRPLGATVRCQLPERAEAVQVIHDILGGEVIIAPALTEHQLRRHLPVGHGVAPNALLPHDALLRLHADLHDRKVYCYPHTHGGS